MCRHIHLCIPLLCRHACLPPFLSAVIICFFARPYTFPSFWYPCLPLLPSPCPNSCHFCLSLGFFSPPMLTPAVYKAISAISPSTCSLVICLIIRLKSSCSAERITQTLKHKQSLGVRRPLCLCSHSKTTVGKSLLA